MQRALVGGILVGTICAVIGTYVVLRGLAFIGDALAHAAFPGVVIAYMLKANIYLGAAIFTVANGAGHRLRFPASPHELRYDHRHPVRRGVRPGHPAHEHDPGLHGGSVQLPVRQCPGDFDGGSARWWASWRRWS